MTPVEPAPTGCRILIHAQPRASRSELAGCHGDALKVRLRAPPVDGAANEELRRFLAERLGVPAGAVRLLRGESGRRKVVEVTGLDPVEAIRRLGLSGPAPGQR